MALVALALTASVGCAIGPDAQAEARPDQLIRLADGRQINVRCRGRGQPTVLFESGFGAGVGGWGRVQPRVARLTRACTYDRAGYGFSDVGPDPRDGAAIARDLDEALDQAGVAGPYVVVGHSAGALYARLIAARRPGEVLGLVLVDPTVENLAPPGRDGVGGIRRRLQRCLAAAESGLEARADDVRWAGCLPARPSEQDFKVARTPASWRNQLSELDAIFADTSRQAFRTRSILTDVPGYVITASDTAAAAPTVGYGSPRSLLELQHIGLALQFAHGSQRTIYSSHLVQNDRPEVVAEAVEAMVRAVRAGKPPEPLPLSETAPPEGEPAFPESP